MGECTQGELAFRLRKADGQELRRLVEEHFADLGLKEVRQILLNPYVSSEVIENVAADRRLTSLHELRTALARHPKTPEATALRFLPGLFWRELLEVGVDVRSRPVVRKVAERYLLQRLPRLASGEKVALARRAGRDVLVRLLRDPSLGVVRAALDNARLTEALLLPLVADATTGPRVLDLVAAHPRWRAPYALRRELALNPLTPLRVAFRLLPGLRPGDLRQVAARGELSSPVRHRARKLLGEGGPAPVGL